MADIAVLHVEDSNADALLLKLTLTQSLGKQHKLSRVTDIDSAKLFLKHNIVDVVLLDLHLPDSHGIDTLQQLRLINKNVAIVLLTGCDDEDVALMAIKKGAQDYLAKNELTAQSISRAIRYAIDRKKYEQEIVTLANQDTLTGLPNRMHCMDHLHHELAKCRREEYHLAIMFIDCDHFKMVNDLMGHSKGDEYLIGIANTLKNTLRSSDYVARIGGDEFIIILRSADDPLKFSATVSDKIHQALRRGITISSDEVLDARCSIGISIQKKNQATLSQEQFIHEADTAMYSAKQTGGNCSRYFDEQMEQASNRRLTLLKNIKVAFEKKEFYLNYQPILNTKTNEFTGVEVLLRWKNSAGELISPVDFIPLLEESGLIIDVGKWVLETACREFVSFTQSLTQKKSPWLSINVSPVQLQNKKFFEVLKTIITNTGISSHCVHLEITESLFLERSEHILNLLNKINALGCEISIDDFGVGYSSMSSLKDLPVSTLKIDRTFILNCQQSDADKAIVKAMVSLAHNLQMVVVAEGIENNAVAEFLIGLNCQYLQGYYFSRPLSFEQLKIFLK